MKYLLLLTFLISPFVFAKDDNLSFDQSQIFRSWFVRIIEEQLRQGPSPKWVQRDCVGLIRFASREAFKEKDRTWYHSHGFSNRPLPPELKIPGSERIKLSQWKLNDGSGSQYISAMGLIQNNTFFISKDVNQARPGDFLFFDLGDSQHLMVWMGKFVAYHTGTVTKNDQGLRQVDIEKLFAWKDSRWRPKQNNPNFIGIFRLGFLSY